jgi:hypothetical protein
MRMVPVDICDLQTGDATHREHSRGVDGSCDFLQATAGDIGVSGLSRTRPDGNRMAEEVPYRPRRALSTSAG